MLSLHNTSRQDRGIALDHCYSRTLVTKLYDTADCRVLLTGTGALEPGQELMNTVTQKR